MSNSDYFSEYEQLKFLEVQLARAFGNATRHGFSVAANLIGAAMEDVGDRIEQHHGAIGVLDRQRNRFNN